jgi:hypothetical protein
MVALWHDSLAAGSIRQPGEGHAIMPRGHDRLMTRDEKIYAVVMLQVIS